MSTFTRNPIEILEDAICKKRVLDGIALLEESYGPDWADKIDLDTLRLSSASSCVLGQLYHGAEVSDEEVERYASHLADAGDYDARSASEAASEVRHDDGFTRGIAIIDGPLFEHGGPEKHGFDMGSAGTVADLADLDDDALASRGVTREMVDAANEHAREIGWGSIYLEVSYDDLQGVWVEEISARKQ